MIPPRRESEESTICGQILELESRFFVASLLRMTKCRCRIRGLGSFAVRSYDGYKGRNPRRGELVDVPPKKLPFFKVGKALKQTINSLT